jgi:teichuronic acid biosynthesis glycosyltransferase TuaG
LWLKSGEFGMLSSRVERDRGEVTDVASEQVSVICTAKNAAGTIAATIESILAQDIQSWEMIVVDDGSTDDTASIVRGFASSDPRIRLIATQGVGRGRALNLALAEANADLVANIDADDEGHPCRLRCQVEAMKQNPEFAIMATEWFRVYDAARPVWPEINAGSVLSVEDITGQLAISNPICHASVMMRRAAILELGGYDEGRRFVFDADLWVRAIAAGLRLGCLQLPLAARRIHPGQHFLHSPRLPYLSAALQVKTRAMRLLGVRTRDLPMIALQLLWSTLPLKVRNTVIKLGTGRRIGKIRLR